MKKNACIAVFIVAVPLLGQAALAHQGGKAGRGVRRRRPYRAPGHELRRSMSAHVVLE
ncbi:MAG: hypothetical protein AAB658_13265 [Chloroflexota bacterium]